MNLSRNFTLAELTVSQEAARSGLPNKPNADQVERLRRLCAEVLQPLRDALRCPVVVTSGYRSPTINRRIGGSVSSQHCRGEAADLIVPGMEPAEVVARIHKLALPVDQCIEEFGRWVHVSHGPRHRRQYLAAQRAAGETVYKPWSQA